MQLTKKEFIKILDEKLEEKLEKKLEEKLNSKLAPLANKAELKKQTKELKAFSISQTKELARMVSNGFEDLKTFTVQRVDELARVASAGFTKTEERFDQLDKKVNLQDNVIKANIQKLSRKVGISL